MKKTLFELKNNQFTVMNMIILKIFLIPYKTKKNNIVIGLFLAKIQPTGVCTRVFVCLLFSIINHDNQPRKK